jgi:hypothetical protein
MKTLRFGLDFTSWSDAPKLISKKLGPAGH